VLGGNQEDLKAAWTQDFFLLITNWNVALRRDFEKWRVQEEILR
jgi:hypothetical protein